MSYRTDNDNLYTVGTEITTKADPSRLLLIAKYYQRIYYCSIVGGEDGAKKLPFFERELLAPS